MTNRVSLSTEIHTTAAFRLNNAEKGSDIVSVIQKDLSTKLGNITLAHSELPKDGRFSSKAGGCEDQTGFRPSTKGCIQTLLSADCKTGECCDGLQQDCVILFSLFTVNITFSDTVKS